MTWEQLVADHHATVYRIALGIVRDRAAAEDVTQDVYLDLLRRPGSLDRADDPAAFLGRCAGRVAFVAAVAVVGLALFAVAPRLYRSWEAERRRAEQDAAVAAFVPEAVRKHREDWKAAEEALSPSARVRLDEADRQTEVHGLVVRDDMTPVAGAVLRAMLRPWGDLVPARLSEGEEEPGPSTTSADDGTFALKLAPGSEAQLHVSASGYPAFFLPEVHAGERLLVVVPRGSRIEILARDGGGVPLAGVRFRAAAAREEMDLVAELSGVTDAAGLCVLDFPGGCWAMLVADRGDVGAARERIWLEPGGVARRELVIQGGRDIDGRVLDAETGLAISGASVTLGFSAQREATTDAEGRFHVSAWTDEGIPAPVVIEGPCGEIARATADSEGIADFERLPRVPLRAAAEAEAALAAVRLPGVKSGLWPDGREVTLILGPSVNVTGIATDPEGRPVEDTTVQVEVDGETAVSVPADASGRFVIRVSADPARKQILRASAEYPWREGSAELTGGEVRIVMEEPK